MKKSINYFSRVLGALLLCAGLVVVGCTEGPLGGENSEQGGNGAPEPLVTASIQNVKDKTVEVTGKLNVSPSDLPFSQVVVYYTSEESFNVNTAKSITTTTFDNEQNYTVTLTKLDYNTKYSYCVYAKSKSDEIYTDIADFTTSQHPYLKQTDVNVASATDLSSSATANCYIVSEAGIYKFKPVKGNSNESVGDVASASILWETFGTSTAPEMLDLIRAFCYKDGYIAFQTADTFKEGNAVIAAKDVEGNILWSWHIWLTDEPQGQEYYNNAGTMMDRNLGATSATPGDVGALGLLYQWGRKDPFLCSSSISDDVDARSTITWPSAVESTSSNGTIAFATANPTTFIKYNRSNWDWYYTSSSSTDNTRWTTSDNPKTIYDPCPAGWRVPDGGSNSIWSKAGFDVTLFDSTNEGISFSISSPSTTWYPASGSRDYLDGRLGQVITSGNYWSASPNSSYSYNASSLYFSYHGNVYPASSNGGSRANGYSVRCLQE